MGCPVQLTSFDYWSPPLPADQRDPWFETLQRPVGARIALHFTMPNHCSPRRGMCNVNYTMFEAAGIPAEWALRSREHARVAVPTEACRDAWCASGVPPAKLRVSPLGVDGDWFRQPAPRLTEIAVDGRPLDTFRYRFLNVAEMRPRKNLLGLLRTWMRATHRDDDAVLILKCSVFQRQNIALFSEDLRRTEQRAGRSLADAAPVVLVPRTLSDHQMRSLYHSATHYISMSHGEGWDRP